MIRGPKNQCDLFRMYMQTQMFCWKRKNLKTKKDEVTLVQGALRECGFIYEYVFPEECLDEVLTMLDTKNTDDSTMLGVRAWVLRKALGKGAHKVEPVPDYKEIPRQWVKIGKQYLTTQRYIEKRSVAIYLIGIRRDPRKDYDFKEEGKWNQEGL